MIFKISLVSKTFVCFLLATASLTLFAAPLKVVTTLPDLAEVVRAVGGDDVTAEALLRGSEDAHFVDALPSFSLKVSRADAVCVVGLGLEIGWMPKVLAKSANANVQPGGKGYCEAGKSVTAIDVQHGAVDRSMGDVHPEGNPHFQLSPSALAQSSIEVLRLLQALRPTRAEAFASNQKVFVQKMNALETSIRTKLQAAKLSEAKFIEYHKDFGYFFKAYGLTSVGSIEEKPGVLPSAARLASVAREAAARKVTAALSTTHSPERQMQKFGELSGVAVLRVPGGILIGDLRYDSIEKVQNAIVDSILNAKRN